MRGADVALASAGGPRPGLSVHRLRLAVLPLSPCGRRGRGVRGRPPAPSPTFPLLSPFRISHPRPRHISPRAARKLICSAYVRTGVARPCGRSAAISRHTGEMVSHSFGDRLQKRMSVMNGGKHAPGIPLADRKNPGAGTVVVRRTARMRRCASCHRGTHGGRGGRRPPPVARARASRLRAPHSMAFPTTGSATHGSRTGPERLPVVLRRTSVPGPIRRAPAPPPPERRATCRPR